MKAVLKKELRLMFYSPTAYVLIGLFLLVTSLMFSSYYLASSVNYARTLTSMGAMLIFIIPILTMRVFAEESKNGTYKLLLYAPTEMWKIVLGKYLAVFSVFLIMTVLTGINLIVMKLYGGYISKTVWSGYIGFILMGAAFIIVGVLMSALTENQIQAAIFSFIILLVSWVADKMAIITGGTIAKILSSVSFYSRFEMFTNGILSIKQIVFYLSIIVLFFVVTIMVMEKKRWDK